MPTLDTAVGILRTQGLGWLLYRLLYAAHAKLGLLRFRMPARPWSAQPLAIWLRPGIPHEPTAYLSWRHQTAPPFFFSSLPEYPPALACTDLRNQGEGILAGRWRYFHHLELEVGFPPNWHFNPLRGRSAPADRHWSEISDFDYGDIKLIWDANRFGVAYTLVRAYAASRDERFAEAFWTLVEDWAVRNPPQCGPNWKCGQEVAFRLMAWCFTLYGLASSPRSSAARVGALAVGVAVQAERIRKNIGYARAQKNNHAISEAVGLWTVGLLFPEFKESQEWLQVGREVLEAEARRQIYSDGTYLLHSTNYQRLILQDYLWALRLGELHGQRLSEELYDRFARAVDFLERLVDPDTGRVPNCGSNDGTLVLPLNSCDFSDIRPAVQACRYFLSRTHPYPTGSWDEDLLWLFGADALRRKAEAAPAEISQVSTRVRSDSDPSLKKSDAHWSARIRGHYTIRGKDSRAFLRCAYYRDRPSQADQLHLDLWWRGINLLCDAGSYLYNGDPPWDNAFASTRVHNTVTLDHQDQMRRYGPFLWYDWAQATARWEEGSPQGSLAYWEAECSIRRPPAAVHRRAVLRAGDSAWIVADDILGQGERVARLHWLAPDFSFQLDAPAQRLRLETSSGPVTLQVWCSQPVAALDLVRAGKAEARTEGFSASAPDDPIRGWRSPHYAAKEPALSVGLEAKGRLPLRFLTLIALAPVTVERLDSTGLVLRFGHQGLAVRLSALARTPLLEQAQWLEADRPDSLVLVDEAAANASEVHTLLIHQAFVSPAEPGGTRHYELARLLSRRRQRWTIVASNVSYLTGKRVDDSNSPGGLDCSNGVRVRRVYALRSLHRSFVWRMLSFFTFAFTSALGSLRVTLVDVVMGTSPPIFQAFSAWLVAFLRRRPFLLEIRDLWPDFAIQVGVLTNPILIWLSRRLERFLYRQAKHLVVNSPAYRDYLLQKGVAAEKITVIPNGVDPDMFDPTAEGAEIRSRFGLEGKFLVTYAGAIGLANDLETILRAAARLRDLPEVHFLLVGDGMKRPQLEALAQSWQLSNITFAGAQPKYQMPSFLAASDACIAILRDIAMFRTTYPNKVFDYMAAARPTILAIDGVIRQVVEAAGGGLFVPPGDDAALADAVRTLSRDRPRTRALGAAARAYVIKHFHREQQVEQFAALLSRLAGQQPGQQLGRKR